MWQDVHINILDLIQQKFVKPNVELVILPLGWDNLLIHSYKCVLISAQSTLSLLLDKQQLMNVYKQDIAQVKLGLK